MGDLAFESAGVCLEGPVEALENPWKSIVRSILGRLKPFSTPSKVVSEGPLRAEVTDLETASTRKKNLQIPEKRGKDTHEDIPVRYLSSLRILPGSLLRETPQRSRVFV